MMEQNPAVQRLRVLELKRIEMMKEHHGKAPGVTDDLDDPILDEMDIAWWAMSEEEQDHCRKQGPNHTEIIYWIDQSKNKR